MSQASRTTAGILLVLFPAVVYGGVSILSLLVGDPGYSENPLRQDLWRAGHAHAGVLLVLSLVTLRYVDETRLPKYLKTFARHSVPASAVLLPLAFFLSVASPDATEPNALINLAYVGAVLLAGGLLVLGVGLLRNRRGFQTSMDDGDRARTSRGGETSVEDSCIKPQKSTYNLRGGPLDG